jgi:hypothetical protein
MTYTYMVMTYKLKEGETKSAFTFGENVRELINQFERKPMLIITGQSYGGFLAQIVTYMKQCDQEKHQLTNPESTQSSSTRHQPTIKYRALTRAIHSS